MECETDISAKPDPRVFWAGVDGVLLRFALTPESGAMTATQLLAADLEHRTPSGTVEIAPGLVSVLLRFDPARTQRDVLAKEMLARARQIMQGPLDIPDSARRWTIPVAFGDADGPQLSEVAQAVGCSPDAAIRQICETELRVLVIGFAPGQPYIGLLPEAWDLPRQSELTPTVPAGAVVVAVRQIVMFGAASATGWRQVGRSAFRSFRPERDTPMPLRAGDAIRFARVSVSEIEALEQKADGLGGAQLEVLR
ncbi:5-oxoprolinase subunit B family protein [Paracoccus saliphilus]|uniref:Sensor histidine kinase inhibitor, KipI family n=1 Tax=Paracoccus saliphilus TaxID=405559 RepID=A0AA46A3Q0_9RHOB|nr:carboxyltransferase domain-containing protein [Paracoccus saliphilus]SIS49161.1 sensor histidine kinase inhibitor, KipI family [Paracoccus saliphilus]